MRTFIYALAVVSGVAMGLVSGSLVVRGRVAAPAANATVTFTCCSYSPISATINAGESVTWNGSFQFHPLIEVTGPSSTTPQPGGFSNSTGSSYQVTFNTPGTYYYMCNVHSGFGMRGEVQVLAATADTTDLQISKTDGTTSVSVGQALTYTVHITNAGPGAANNTQFADFFPGGFTPASVNVALFGGATAGTASFSLSQLSWPFTLPAGSRVQMTITGAVNVNAAGFLTNTAVITAPAGVTDTVPSNNLAVDLDSVAAGPSTADLQISKTDDATSVSVGQALTYTVHITNAGPGAANNAQFTDFFPGGFTPASANVGLFGGATAGTASFSLSQLSWPFTLPAGSRVTIVIPGAVNVNASGFLTNTGVITAPAGVTDTVPSNNLALDVDSVAAGPSTVDLQVSKTDDATSVSAGQALTYTVQITNAGPSAANNAQFTDFFPGGFIPANAVTTLFGGAVAGPATFNASQFSRPFTLPVNARVSIVITGTVNVNASGLLTNTAVITAPAGVTDTAPSNNLAVDVDSVISVPPSADVQVSKTDGVAWVQPGQGLTYTVLVTNAGPGPAAGLPFTDTFSSGFTPAFAQVVGSPGSGVSGFTLTLNALTGVFTLPAGGRISVTLSGAVAVDASGWLTNTASVSMPAGTTDPVPGDLSAVDIDVVLRRVYVPVTLRDAASNW